MKEEVEKRRSMRAKCIMMVEDKEVFVDRLHHNRQEHLQVSTLPLPLLIPIPLSFPHSHATKAKLYASMIASTES